MEVPGTSEVVGYVRRGFAPSTWRRQPGILSVSHPEWSRHIPPQTDAYGNVLLAENIQDHIQEPNVHITDTRQKCKCTVAS